MLLLAISSVVWCAYQDHGNSQPAQAASALRIRVKVQHGDWDENIQNCVGSKGICRILILITFTRRNDAQDTNVGEMWYDGERLHLAALAESYQPEAFEANFAPSSYTVSREIPLPDDLCDALGIARGSSIQPGTYAVRNAGPEYGSADREIVF